MNLSVDELVERGRRYHDLLDDQSWIIRQVKSLEYLELPSVAIRTSITIDGKVLAERLRYPADYGGVVEIPLGLFPNALFGDFDVCDNNGRSLPLLGSRYDSQIAVGIMLSELVSQGVSVSSLSSQVLNKLKRIAQNHDGDGIVEALDWIAATLDSPDIDKYTEIFGEDLYEIIISKLDDIDAFLTLLSAFGAQYVPIVQVEASALKSAFVVKYSEVTHSPELGLYNKWGGFKYLLRPRAGTLDIRNTNLGMAGSQHFRVRAPKGTVLADVTLVDPEQDAPSLQQHIVHITPRWTSLYTNYSNDIGSQDVRVEILPDARSTVLPAIAALMLSVALLGVGIVLQLCDAFGSNSHSTLRLEKIAAQSSGAIVAIFLLLPSLYMLALFRKGEHGLATILLRPPRYIVLAASIIVVGSAIPATFSASSYTIMSIWVVAFLVAMFVLSMIVWYWRKIEHLESLAGRSWNMDTVRGGPQDSGW